MPLPRSAHGGALAEAAVRLSPRLVGSLNDHERRETPPMTQGHGAPETGALHVRASTKNDEDAIDDLLDACRRQHLGTGAHAGEARERICWPGADPATDSVVAFDGSGRALGFGHLWV